VASEVIFTEFVCDTRPVPTPHPPELLKQNLALTWSHVLHVIKFTLLTMQANHAIIILEFAHLKFQRFPRPLPPLYITKHPLILFSANFASYFDIKTKFVRWTQPLIFMWLQRSWDHYSVAPIFLREFNFANGDFCVCFAWLIFAIGETVHPSLELIFAIFRKPPSIWNYNSLVFWV